jgi:Ca2+-binding RTX toxin-like protein
MALLCLLAASSGAAAGDTTLVSIDNSGAQGDSYSSYGTPSVSADGRYVAFVSAASNLVEDDTNGFRDVFVRDLQEGTIQRVSVSSSGAQADEAIYGYGSSISANGRHVAFLSLASNLVEGDTNGFVDVFVHDRTTGATKRVSIDTSGTQANGSSFGHLSVSADGRYVAFSSWASNLLPNGWDNPSADVFVRDRDTDADGTFDESGAVSTERVSWSQYPSWSGNGSSFAPSISSDGRHVAFFSTSSNLVDGDTNNATDVFVRDRQTSAIQRARVDCPYSVCDTTVGGHNTSISADGRFVAFHAPDSSVVEGDANGFNDVFVYDRTTDTRERVSAGGSGTQADGASSAPKITPDGSYVSFHSTASNLVQNDTNGFTDVFVYQRTSDTTQRVSVGGSGIQANGGSSSSSISTDGRFVAFYSGATNLVENDTNGFTDVFVHERDDTAAPDTTAPSITLSTPSEGATYNLNQTVTADYSCQDEADGSGVASCRGTVPDGSAVDTATSGTKTFTVSASDNAGNASSVTHTYTVVGSGQCTKTGTASAETISGTSRDDVICAGGGNDTLKGLDGNDTLKGEAGNDKLLGGLGNDALDGGLGTDTGSYSASLTAVDASLATNSATGEGSDTFLGVENLLGSSKADTLTGSGTNNRLTGGGGGDTEQGGSGNDTVIGGGGGDTLKGEDGNDTVNSKDNVSGNDSLDGGAGTDTKVTDATEKSVVGFP